MTIRRDRGTLRRRLPPTRRNINISSCVIAQKQFLQTWAWLHLLSLCQSVAGTRTAASAPPFGDDLRGLPSSRFRASH